MSCSEGRAGGDRGRAGARRGGSIHRWVMATLAHVVCHMVVYENIGIAKGVSLRGCRRLDSSIRGCTLSTQASLLHHRPVRMPHTLLERHESGDPADGQAAWVDLPEPEVLPPAEMLLERETVNVLGALSSESVMASVES